MVTEIAATLGQVKDVMINTVEEGTLIFTVAVGDQTRLFSLPLLDVLNPLEISPDEEDLRQTLRKEFVGQDIDIQYVSSLMIQRILNLQVNGIEFSSSNPKDLAVVIEEVAQNY